MMLGTKARYAVMAMVELARREAIEPVTLAELAEAQEITVPYLEQIFSKLKRANLIAAVRGPGGGYMLAKKAADITVAEIVEASDESLKMTRCERHSELGCMSGSARCRTHTLWEGLEQHIHDYLQAITLKNVCDGKISLTFEPKTDTNGVLQSMN